VFGANREEDVLLKEELNDLQKMFSERFEVVYLLSETGKRDLRMGDRTHRRCVTKEIIENVIGGRPRGDDKVFVCGPPSMERALIGGTGKGNGILAEFGFEQGQVHVF
jgi:cytochrome-b5 reductase